MLILSKVKIKLKYTQLEMQRTYHIIFRVKTSPDGFVAPRFRRFCPYAVVRIVSFLLLLPVCAAVDLYSIFSPGCSSSASALVPSTPAGASSQGGGH